MGLWVDLTGFMHTIRFLKLNQSIKTVLFKRSAHVILLIQNQTFFLN